MPKQIADRIQVDTCHSKRAREMVSEIMKPEVCNLCILLEPVPAVLNVGDGRSGGRILKDILGAGVLRTPLLDYSFRLLI